MQNQDSLATESTERRNLDFERAVYAYHEWLLFEAIDKYGSVPWPSAQYLAIIRERIAGLEQREALLAGRIDPPIAPQGDPTSSERRRRLVNE